MAAHLAASLVNASKPGLVATTTKDTVEGIGMPNPGNAGLQAHLRHGSVEGTIVKTITIKEGVRRRPGLVEETTTMEATIRPGDMAGHLVVDLLRGNEMRMLPPHHRLAISMGMVVIQEDMARAISKAWGRPQAWPPAPVGWELLRACRPCFKAMARMGALVVLPLHLRPMTHLPR